MKVVIRGPLLSKSGYGEHSRQVFRWALTRGHDVRAEITPWGLTSWYVNPVALDGLVGMIMRSSANKIDDVDMSMQVQLPNEWTPGLARRDIGITAGVEATISPPTWAAACSAMSSVIVPSIFSRSSLLAGGPITSQVHVVPEAYSESFSSGRSLSRLDIQGADETYNFLLFGQVTGNNPDTDRKNIFYTVKWFCEEFAGDRSVKLFVKTNLGTNCVFHRRMLCDMFGSLIREVRKGEFPKVSLLVGDMTIDECASLVSDRRFGAMLSLTKGEGYGLPILDAAAAGLPIIATNWSGHLDYLKLGKFTAVDYDLVPIPAEKVDDKIFVKGAQWAMPKEQSAKRHMRRTFLSPNVPREWASDLQRKILPALSIDTVMKAYDSVVESTFS